jgi:hypothetical protein
VLTTGNLISVFVTLLVTIGPVDTAAVFMGLTSGVHKPERRSLAHRVVLIAGVVLILFEFAGALVLDLLHVSLPAFRVSGGIFLFMQAVTLTFSSPGGGACGVVAPYTSADLEGRPPSHNREIVLQFLTLNAQAKRRQYRADGHRIQLGGS